MSMRRRFAAARGWQRLRRRDLGVLFTPMAMGYHWGGGAHILVGILALLVFVGLITAMVLVVARLFGAGHRVAPAAAVPPPAPGGSAQPSAREILDRRLASGEITPEHYDEVRAKLDGAAG